MQLITEQVKQLQWPDYDINVWSEDGMVMLTFYPLRYPGDSDYPDEELDHGFPLVNTSVFYTLRIPADSRGPRNRDALEYLKSMVNADHFDVPEYYPSPLWDATDGMDWWSCETQLTDAPELIRDFVSKLPRRGQLKAGE